MVYAIYFTVGEGDAETYTYGITSLADKRDFIQKGDAVKFQIATVKETGNKRATNIMAVRNYVRAKVDSIKGQVCLTLQCIKYFP